MKVLYEIIVPTIYGDTMKPIRTAHHKEWDKFVQSITGGLTIFAVGKGKWVDSDGTEYPERVIPVRVMVEEEIFIPEFDDLFNFKPRIYETSQIDKIVKFTLSHYRQKAVMYYKVSDNVQVVYAA